jgi:hypothetical protein
MSGYKISVSDSQRLMFPHLCCLTHEPRVFIPHEATANSECRIGQKVASVYNVKDEDLGKFATVGEQQYEDDDQQWAELGFEIEKANSQSLERHVVEYIPKGCMKVAKTFHTLRNLDQRPIMHFYRPEDLVGTSDAPREYNYTTQSAFYELLQVAKPATRVVELIPGGPQDKLECNIRTVNLDEPLEYEALSYTWKESSFDWPVDDRWTSAQEQDIRNVCDVRVPIYIAGTNSFIGIGSGLRDALRCLRHPEKKRLVWVDQICINQKDTHERATQVGYMHDVYSKAQQVILWVGEEDQDTEQVYKFFEVFGGRLAADSRDGKMRVPLPKEIQPNPETHPKEWEGVLKFLGRPVFSRGWVIQEVTRGGSVIVKCGVFETSWDNVACLTRLIGSANWLGTIAHILRDCSEFPSYT